MKQYKFLDLKDVNAPYMDELIEAAGRVIKSGRYIGGAEVEGFEAELAELTGSSHAVALSNGLDALRLTLRALIELGRLREGDGVIVPANTYIASILAICDAGLKPVLTDPDPDTMNLSAESIERMLKPGVKAVMPVHLYGRVAWDDRMRELIERYNLIVVEDCAQSIGAIATADGLGGKRNAGALGNAGCLSFYPTKNIGALGDAGAVTTSDAELAKTVRALATYGSDRRYHNIYQGFNCRMDPIQAAMLRVKLPHTRSENADRFALALAYSRTIRNPYVITPLISRAVTDCVWHQYVIRVSDNRRDQMKSRLAEYGVETDIHYAVAPHMQPCFAGLEHDPLPITEQLASEVLSLPIARGTSVEDAANIAEIINSITF